MAVNVEGRGRRCAERTSRYGVFKAKVRSVDHCLLQDSGFLTFLTACAERPAAPRHTFPRYLTLTSDTLLSQMSLLDVTRPLI